MAGPDGSLSVDAELKTKKISNSIRLFSELIVLIWVNRVRSIGFAIKEMDIGCQYWHRLNLPAHPIAFLVWCGHHFVVSDVVLEFSSLFWIVLDFSKPRLFWIFTKTDGCARPIFMASMLRLVAVQRLPDGRTASLQTWSLNHLVVERVESLSEHLN